jgi:hypothetical protein
MPPADPSAKPADVLARIQLPYPGAETPPPWNHTPEFAVTGEAIWAGVALGELIVRVDLETYEVATLSPPYPVSPVAGGAGLWLLGPVATQFVHDSSLLRVDEDSLETTEFEFGKPIQSVAVADDAVWVVRSGRLLKLDPRTAEVLASARTDGRAVRWVCGDVWVIADTDIDERVVLGRVDGATAAVGDTIDAPPGILHEVGGRCWYVADAQLFELVDDALIDTGIVRRHQLVDGAMWSVLVGHVLQRFDPLTGTTVGPRWALDPVELEPDAKGRPDWQLISAADSLWLLNRDQLIRYDIPTGRE